MKYLYLILFLLFSNLNSFAQIKFDKVSTIHTYENEWASSSHDNSYLSNGIRSIHFDSNGNLVNIKFRYKQQTLPSIQKLIFNGDGSVTEDNISLSNTGSNTGVKIIFEMDMDQNDNMYFIYWGNWPYGNGGVLYLI
tara:strand:- start:31 stop:441 length:411 start_codon:yes stop_codon:yes gene_type:complete